MDSSSTEHMFRELATVLYVSLHLDRLKNDNVEELKKLEKLLEPCAKEAAPYRHLALELKAILELRQNNHAKAAEIFVSIAQDPKCPKDLQTRAQVMTQNLASQMAEQAQKGN